MKSSFNQRTQSAITGGFINFSKVGIRAEDIEVIGNWHDQQGFLVYLKDGNNYKMKEVKADMGVMAYIAAVTTHDIIEMAHFAPDKRGYYRKGQSGLIIVPDVNGTILAILAENVSIVEDASSKKAKKIQLKTTGKGHVFSAECTKDEFTALYKRAMLGEHVALWPEKWPHLKPRLSSLGLTSTPKAAIKLK